MILPCAIADSAASKVKFKFAVTQTGPTSLRGLTGRKLIQKMEEYRLDAPWLIKIVGVILFIGVMAAIILDIASLIELWRHGHVLDIAMAALFLFGAPYILLIVLFTNTRFTDAGIVHTNFLLSKTRKRYDEIKTIEITR